MYFQITYPDAQKYLYLLTVVNEWDYHTTIVPLSTIIYFTTFRKQTFWEENKKLVFKGSNFAKHGALMALKVAIRVQK